jgi:hypothetical protein
MAWAQYGMCESNTAVLCKSNGKDTTQTLNGTALQVNGIGTAWERQGMCELAFKGRSQTLEYEVKVSFLATSKSFCANFVKRTRI